MSPSRRASSMGLPATLPPARAVSRVDQIGERRQIAQWVFWRALFHPADSDLLRCRVAVVAPHRSLSRRFQWLTRLPLRTDTVVQLPCIGIEYGDSRVREFEWWCAFDVLAEIESSTSQVSPIGITQSGVENVR